MAAFLNRSSPRPVPEGNPSPSSIPRSPQSRGRRCRWFGNFPLLRRRSRNRRAPQPVEIEDHHLHHLPSLPSIVFHHSNEDTASSRFGESPPDSPPVTILGPGAPDPDSGSSPQFHIRFSRSSLMRFGPSPHGREEMDNGSDSWMGSMELESGSREIEAAMQAIFMDGLAGALQARTRRRPLVWLSEDEDRWTYEELLELDKNNVKRGLKQKEIAKLERWHQVEGAPAADCQICIAETCAGDLLAKLPCSHSYHDACIIPWLNFNRTCPVCRYEFSG